MESDKKICVPALALALAPFCVFAQETDSAATAAVPAEDGGSRLVVELPQLPSAENVKVKVSGLVQAQYVYATASGGNASDQNGFSVRRSSIGITADVGDAWSAKIVYEFDSGSKGDSNYSEYIDTAVISRKFDDAGTLTVGHKKTHFMLEEYSPSSKFLCMERSLNSNFVNGNSYVRGLSGYHIGVFWDGTLGDAIDYGVSLTNAVAKDYDSKSNDLALTGNVGYTLSLDDASKIYFGLNATVNFGDDGDSGALTNAGTVWGLEPYVQFTSGGLTAIADFFWIDGDSDSGVHSLYGLNLTAAYRLDNGFEPAVRFTYLNTDSDCSVNASIQNRVPATLGNDCATTYYVGVNYYFNKYVKLAAGYEYGHYFGGAGRTSDDSGAFRTMLQVSF